MLKYLKVTGCDNLSVASACMDSICACFFFFELRCANISQDTLYRRNAYLASEFFNAANMYISAISLVQSVSSVPISNATDAI